MARPAPATKRVEALPPLASSLAPWRELDVHRVVGAGERRWKDLRLRARHETPVGHAGKQLLEHHPYLEAGERRAETEVRAEAEGHMVVVAAASHRDDQGRGTPARRDSPTSTSAAARHPRGSAGRGIRDPRWPCGAC